MTKQGPVQPPDLAALLNDFRDHVLFKINCHQLGTIVSFDAAAQTAQVALLVLRVVGDRTVPYPLLVDVPVYVPCGGRAVLTLPIASGDPCLVLFNDRDIDNWFETGAVSAPNSDRAHSLADGLAIVGFRSKASPVANYSTTDAQLRMGNTLVGMDGSKIEIKNGTRSLQGLLEALVGLLYAWKNTDTTTPDATTKANIIDWQTKVNNLLK